MNFLNPMNLIMAGAFLFLINFVLKLINVIPSTILSDVGGLLLILGFAWVFFKG